MQDNAPLSRRQGELARENAELRERLLRAEEENEQLHRLFRASGGINLRSPATIGLFFVFFVMGWGIGAVTYRPPPDDLTTGTTR